MFAPVKARVIVQDAGDEHLVEDAEDHRSDRREQHRLHLLVELADRQLRREAAEHLVPVEEHIPDLRARIFVCTVYQMA